MDEVSCCPLDALSPQHKALATPQAYSKGQCDYTFPSSKVDACILLLIAFITHVNHDEYIGIGAWEE